MPLSALARLAEDREMQAEPALVSERVPPEEIDRALVQALACPDDRKRGEQALESLRRKENEAIERLQELVRAQEKDRHTDMRERASASRERRLRGGVFVYANDKRRPPTLTS